MKKVLFSATVDSHILHFHLPYLKMFKEKGYEVHVATNTDDTIPFCDVKHKVSFERSPFKINNLKAIKQMKKILLDNNFDIVHTHTPMGSVVTRLAYKKVRSKVNTRMIYTAHGFHFYKGAPLLNWLLFYPVEKYLSKYTDTLITINKEDYKLAKKKFKKCRSVEYVPGVGIDEDKFNFTMTKSEKLELRKSLGLKENDFVLIYPAEISKRKRHIWLINTISPLLRKNRHIHLLLPGSDSLNGKAHALTKKMGFTDQIHFLGYRTDIPKLLRISDLAISSAKQEGLPVNIMEAMYVGLPVVASNCRGNRDLIEDGVNGFLIELNDSERFEKCVEKIYKEKRQYSNNTEKIINYYILDKILLLMEKIYFHPKRIMHLLSSNIYSGAENVACNIIKELNSKYDICYCSPKGNVSEKLKDYSIKYIGIKRMSYHEIKKAVYDFKPDIIHAHDNKATVFASFFHKKCKIISHIHGNNKIMNRRNLKTILFNLCSNNIDKFIWVSDSSLDGYYYKKNILNKSVVLYNVIDTKEVKNKSNAYKVEKKYDLIFLGRLAYPKNPERLIDIMKILKGKKNDITLAIVGDGSDRAKIEQLVHDFGLNDNITFYGYKQNPYPILKNSKILVMTSIYEGTPMCALEAQALGKYIIATPVDGLKKIVINDDNGFLSNDNEELANKIIEFLKKKKLNVNNINSNLEKYLIAIDDIYNRKCSNEKSKCNNSDV